MYKFVGIFIGVIIIAIGGFLLLDSLDILPPSTLDLLSIKKTAVVEEGGSGKTEETAVSSALIKLPAKILGYPTMFAFIIIIVLGGIWTGYVMADPFNMFF